MTRRCVAAGVLLDDADRERLALREIVFGDLHIDFVLRQLYMHRAGFAVGIVARESHSSGSTPGNV